ncbi:MAG: hypothetical protein ACKN9T_12680 [Candidatus Methylumidiphilus sp.]
MITGKTKIVLEGRGAVTISPNDHIGTGGEGSAFRLKDWVIKLYADPDKMSRDGMADKIQLLKAIRHDYIVAPHGLVLDSAAKPIGYYMDYVDGEPLSRVFTNDFRSRTGFADAAASTLVARMRETMQIAHQNQALMVDANELNWITVLGQEPEPRALDVDSWAIGQWPATVIMPSIRDWHRNGFSRETDWFAWGIVTFQIYVGIHPYKGMLDGYKPSDLEARMMANASVFTPGVRLNRAVRDFALIPAGLLDWYRATFQNGERTPPPSPYAQPPAAPAALRVARVVTSGGGMLAFDKLFGDAADPALRIFPCGIVLLASGKLVNLATKRVIGAAKSYECEIIQAGVGWLKADFDHGKIQFAYIDASLQETLLDLDIAAVRPMRYENRMFLVTNQGLAEVDVKIFQRPLLAMGATWGVMVNATRWFDGVGVQDAFGATFLIAPFGEKACGQVRVKELDGLKVVAAKAGHRFIALVGVNANGEYRKLELYFSEDYKQYSIWHGGAANADLNIAILPKRVCATIVDDGELVIFVPSNGTVVKRQDQTLSTAMSLGNWGDRVVYIDQGSVWSVQSKA